MILIQCCLVLLTTRVWTQAPLEERHADQERSPLDFMSRKFLMRNPGSSQKSDIQVSNLPDYKMINTVLAHLERAQSQDQGETYAKILESLPAFLDEGSSIYPEYTESLPESDRSLRHLRGSQRHYSICRLERNTVSLNNDEYEYRPSHYEEIRCMRNDNEQQSSPLNDVCSSLGFSCVQWNKTIHLTRRRYSSGCWETNTRIIPAGCECMWPAHVLGDMKLMSCMFNTEKRY